MPQKPGELSALVDRFEDPWPPGTDVGPRWYPLLRGLDAALAAIAPEHAIQQIKSKFGSLRFYAAEANDPHAYTEEFRETIRLAEWRSIEMCEDCGYPPGSTRYNYTCGLCARSMRRRSARELSRDRERPLTRVYRYCLAASHQGLSLIT